MAAAAAALLPVLVMVLMLMLVMVLVLMLVVMLVLVVMVVAASALLPVLVVMLVLMVMVVLMLVVMVVMVMLLKGLQRLLHQLLLHGVRFLDDLQKLGACELAHRGGDDHRLGIGLPQHLHRRVHLLHIRHIRAAENDGAGVSHLVVEEFSEILHIHLTLGRIHHRHGAVQRHVQVGGHVPDCLHHVGELAHA